MRLVLLQDLPRRRFAAALRRKAPVDLPVGARPSRRAAAHGGFDLLLVGHLRAEKDPLTAMRARGAAANRHRVRACCRSAARSTPALGRGARPAAPLRAYRWLAPCRTRDPPLIRARRLLLLPSLMEGGANVLVEAVTSGVPVLADCAATAACSARDYPGCFPVGDAGACAPCSTGRDRPRFVPQLRGNAPPRPPLFAPEREKARGAATTRSVDGRACRSTHRKDNTMNAPDQSDPAPPHLVFPRRRLRLQDRARRARRDPRRARRGVPAARLLVGIETADDAAVYQLNDEQALVATTDFFMPIVDDPYDFGRIAATNAISDVYAMGGTPIMALALVGMPIDQLPVETIRRILQGGESVCARSRHSDRRRPHHRLGRADLRPGRASASCIRQGQAQRAAPAPATC